MKHIDSGLRCLVVHYNSDDFTLKPVCMKCRTCRQWIEYPYDSECKGEPTGTETVIENNVTITRYTYTN